MYSPKPVISKRSPKGSSSNKKVRRKSSPNVGKKSPAASAAKAGLKASGRKVGGADGKPNKFDQILKALGLGRIAAS